MNTKKLELLFEDWLFHSRWLLAPFYLGLVLGICILLVKFGKTLFSLVLTLAYSEENQIVIGVLTLVDITLVANLLLVMVFVGYETFVSKIDTGDHEDRPEWMGKVTASGLKIKLFSSIVAISGIELLNASMYPASFTNEQLAWKAGIHVIFVISGLLLAVMDRLEHHS